MKRTLHLAAVSLAALLSCAQDAASAAAPLPWPLRAPIVVMNTIATLQFYGGKPGFHHGVDLKAPAGTSLYAPVSGGVDVGYYYPRYKSSYTFRVAIDADDSYRWEFHHIDPASVPKGIMALAVSHGRVEAGTLLGSIFDTSMIPQLGIPPHVHVELLDPLGVRHDPLQRFPSLPHAPTPEIRAVYLVGSDNRAVAGFSGSMRQESLPAGHYDLVVDGLETRSPGTNGDAPYGIEVRAAARVIGSVRFDKLPDADYLKGVSDVYRLAPFTGLDGKPVANQVDTNLPRRFLFHFPLDTAVFGGAETIFVEVHVYNLAGDESLAPLRLTITP